MPRDYELTIEEFNSAYDNVKKYGISKDQMKKLIKKVVKVKNNENFLPPSDCLCLLFRGAFYAFEEATDFKGKKYEQIKCLISNNLYNFMYAPVEYCDEDIIYKLSLSSTQNHNNTTIIKAVTDSIVILLDIQSFTQFNLSELVMAYYTNYSIQSKKIQGFLKADRAIDKKNTFMRTFQKFLMSMMEPLSQISLELIILLGNIIENINKKKKHLIIEVFFLFSACILQLLNI